MFLTSYMHICVKLLIILLPLLGGTSLLQIIVPSEKCAKSVCTSILVPSPSPVLINFTPSYSQVTCGFPFASELALAFPQFLGGDNLKKSPDIRMTDMQKYIEGTVDISAPVVTGWGYTSASDWWVYFNTTTHCVKKITGCDLGDIPCADRHAYQRLVRGPFKAALSTKEESRISGVPDHIKHAILTLPHAYAPRLDAAIHVRAQFHHFEKLASIHDPEYKKEVSDWLNSPERTMVFGQLEGKLLEVLKETRTQQNISDSEPAYVYLASDNEDIKDNFTAILENRDHHHNFEIKVMRVETKFVQHVKNLSKMKKATDNEGLLDLVFDWYALSLANVVFAWRKGSTSMVSTFVHSAQRVSGTTERTEPDGPVGHGIGTKGFQLLKDKRGNPKWDKMWYYSFLEDYQIPL